MKVEIVSHCWRYSRLLTYQLSSLVLHPPQHVEVAITVFHNEEDEPTSGVLDYFDALQVPNVKLRSWKLDRPLLMRRAIGRNLAALATTADWIWFADCDMCFGEGALDALAELPVQEHCLVYPKAIWLHKESRLGDLAVQAVRSPGVFEIDESDFALTGYNRAIGGVQIVAGDYARTAGYCKDTRHLQPTDGRKWLMTTCDVKFRKVADTNGVPVEIPNVFRISHSRSGQNSRGLVL